MAFTDTQLRALSSKLSAKHVRARQHGGRTLSYVEGWHAIAEANRIFGFDAWDRQTTQIRCVWEGSWQGRYACSYVAQVRVRVRAGETYVCREGCGSGHGNGVTPGEAHENAIKIAETDAMKRALVTFGNPFGLALYDSRQQGVRRGKPARSCERTMSWPLLSGEGEAASWHDDPVKYCRAVRQVLETSSSERLKAFWSRNSPVVDLLRVRFPDLKTDSGAHYADILLDQYNRRVNEHPATMDRRAPTAATGDGTRIDKSVLQISAPRRARDKEHLRLVASLPCLVCGRAPSHAHHLRFAQPRAMGRKVSDEWVVPLCATHHGALHLVGDEKEWWRVRSVDPLEEARKLWQEHLARRRKRAIASDEPARHEAPPDNK